MAKIPPNSPADRADGSALYRRVIRAAEELFKKSGFRGVTMEAVARDAAVSKATLYSYFKNKDELFLAVCERMARILSRAFEEAIDTPDLSLDERVLGAVLAKQRLSFTLVRSSPHAEELFTHKAQLAGDIFGKSDEALLERLAGALDEDVALRPSAAQLARALFFGTGELAARCGSVAELDAELRAFVTVHLAGARAVHGTEKGRPATRRSRRD